MIQMTAKTQWKNYYFNWSNTMKTIMHIAKKYDGISETLISTVATTIITAVFVLGLAPAVMYLSL